MNSQNDYTGFNIEYKSHTECVNCPATGNYIGFVNDLAISIVALNMVNAAPRILFKPSKIILLLLVRCQNES